MFSTFKKAALLAAIALPFSTMAAPTVTFQGEVTDQTCSVNINGQTNSVVLLPTVAMADFGATLADGQSAGQTPFTVSVSNCRAPTGADRAINTTFWATTLTLARVLWETVIPAAMRRKALAFS